MPPTLDRSPGGNQCGAGPRIALYSHDTQGLGHVRRNLLIARALAGRVTNPTILLLSGVHEAASFEMPRGVDCLTLPALGKDTVGSYFPRSLSMSTRELVNLRARTIAAAIRSFQPDVLVVDKVPRGAFDELLPTIQSLRSRGRTRLVLGLREILDDPAVVAAEWRDTGFEQIVRAYYDRIWIYGDPSVFDAVREYDLPADLVDRVRYTGYLTPVDLEPAIHSGAELEPVPAPATPPRRVLCVVGGGRDGMPLAEAFAAAELPPGAEGVLVTGPRMPEEARRRLRRLAKSAGQRTVLEFVTDPVPLLRPADRVIAMGGYNTICEIVSLRKPALIVPRETPRREQVMRAERFARLGLVEMLPAAELGPEALSRWLRGPAVTLNGVTVDMDGAARLHGLLEELLTDHGRRFGESIHAAG